MASFEARLQAETARRDAAVARMKCSGSASCEIVTQQIDEAKDFVTREIDHARDAVSSQIEHTQDVVNNQVDRARTALSTQVEALKHAFSPAAIVRAHPWGAALGALLAGIVLAPLVKSFYANPRGRNDGGNIQQESNWKPITDAILANLPALAVAIFKCDAAPAVAKEETPPVAESSTAARSACSGSRT